MKEKEIEEKEKIIEEERKENIEKEEGKARKKEEEIKKKVEEKKGIENKYLQGQIDKSVIESKVMKERRKTQLLITGIEKRGIEVEEILKEQEEDDDEDEERNFQRQKKKRTRMKETEQVTNIRRASSGIETMNIIGKEQKKINIIEEEQEKKEVKEVQQGEEKKQK
ncbi:hypothetical protein ENUP19_0368G0026 [Entamoeba nuttalli]|uniref:Uncharacterized protein n=1 Tax=Entamoeba nuttalli TaxID=412467 RepID=A0ABQ0DYS9_9EUKA